MKNLKLLCLLLVIASMLLLGGCGGETKTLTCDGCGIELQVDADSNMDDSWIIFCKECEPEVMEP